LPATSNSHERPGPDSGSVSPGSDPSPAAPHKPRFAGFFACSLLNLHKRPRTCSGLWQPLHLLVGSYALVAGPVRHLVRAVVHRLEVAAELFYSTLECGSVVVHRFRLACPDRRSCRRAQYSPPEGRTNQSKARTISSGCEPAAAPIGSDRRPRRLVATRSPKDSLILGNSTRDPIARSSSTSCRS
jgi:hypothetical protein